MKRNDYYSLTAVAVIFLFGLSIGLPNLYESYLGGRVIYGATSINNSVDIGNASCFTKIFDKGINFTCGGTITGLSTNQILDNLTINGKIILNNTVWDDMLVDLTSARVGILNPPTLTAFKNTTYIYAFANVISNQEQDLVISKQMSHSYKLGTDINFHLHWSCGTTSNNNVTWGLEVTKANLNGVFGNTVTYYITQACGNAYIHNLADFRSIGSFNDLSGIAIMRLFRNSGNTSDNYAGDDVFAISLDAHYQRDSLGSTLEFIK
jgi:hypothetical protein